MEESSAPNQKLRAARDQKMWTIPEAAEEVGVDPQTFWRWENAVQWPRRYALRKLVTVFGLSVEELGFGRASGDFGHVQPVEEREQADALSPTSLLERRRGSSFIRLTPEQVHAFQVLLEDETTMAHFDPAKRKTLQTLAAVFRNAALVAGTSYIFSEKSSQEASTDPEPWERLAVAHAKPSTLNSATLDRFEHLLGEGWELSNLNELGAAEGILSGFLPKILALPPCEVHARIAHLASQGLRLQSVIIHHRLQIAEKISLCQKSVEYARYAHNPSTLVTALLELAVAYKYNGQLDQWFKTLQEALYYIPQASSLVQSQGYLKSALAFAYHNRKREAELYIHMGLDMFPDRPEHDPAYALADANIYTLSRDAGRVRLEMNQIPETYAAFELYKPYSADVPIPERIRLEIVNGQSKAAIQQNDLEKYTYFLKDGIVGAVTLGSKKRLDEISTTFKEDIPAAWLVQGEIPRIVEQYHLKHP